VLQRLQGTVDAHQREQIAKYGPENGYPTCAPGCSACCHQLVWIELIEAQQIMDRYPRVVARVRANLEAQAELCETQLPEAPKLAASAWWRAEQTCAFLGDDQRCSIYDVRPMTCRVHYVVSPPEQCARQQASEDGSGPVALCDVGGTRMAGPHEVQRIGASSRAASGAADSEVWWGPLPQVFQMALTKGAPK
jgi:Fe-S-cluster containining protein